MNEKNSIINELALIVEAYIDKISGVLEPYFLKVNNEKKNISDKLLKVEDDIIKKSNLLNTDLKKITNDIRQEIEKKINDIKRFVLEEKVKINNLINEKNKKIIGSYNKEINNIKDNIKTIDSKFMDLLKVTKDQLYKTISGLDTTVKKEIKDNIEKINTQFNDLIRVTKDQLCQKISGLDTTVKNDITKVDENINNVKVDINKNIRQINNNYNKLLTNIIPELNKNFEKRCNDIEKNFQDQLTEMQQSIDEKIKSEVEILKQTIDNKISDTNNSFELRYNEIKKFIQEIITKLNDEINAKEQKINEDIKILKDSYNIRLDQFDKRITKDESTIKDYNKKIEEIPKDIRDNIMKLEQLSVIEQRKRFENDKEFKQLIDDAIIIKEHQDTIFYRKKVVVDLPDSISSNEKLLKQIKSIIIPLKEYYSQINRLTFIQTTTNDASFNKLEAEEKEKKFFEQFPIQLNKIRNTSLLMRNFQLAPDIQKIFDFKPEKWIRETFIDFADSFLREYQKAQLDGKQDDLKIPYDIVIEVLKKANIVPVEIILGKTNFDNSIFLARSSTTNNKYRNNTIISVIRNGFKDAGGKLIRQPEVTVNNIL